MFTIHEERHMGFKDCPPKQKSWYLHMGDFAQRTGENHLNCVQALYPHFDHIDHSDGFDGLRSQYIDGLIFQKVNFHV